MAECAGCGEEYRQNFPEQKYHSRSCFLRHINRDSVRQSAKGKKGGDIRGRQLKETSEGKGYAKVDGEDVHLHRRVAESVLGRTLLPGEVVHHEDLNKRNNDPSNLIVFLSQADHARHHKLDHLGEPCACPGIRLGVI